MMALARAARRRLLPRGALRPTSRSAVTTTFLPENREWHEPAVLSAAAASFRDDELRLLDALAEAAAASLDRAVEASAAEACLDASVAAAGDGDAAALLADFAARGARPAGGAARRQPLAAGETLRLAYAARFAERVAVRAALEAACAGDGAAAAAAARPTATTAASSTSPRPGRRSTRRRRPSPTPSPTPTATTSPRRSAATTRPPVLDALPGGSALARGAAALDRNANDALDLPARLRVAAWAEPDRVDDPPEPPPVLSQAWFAHRGGADGRAYVRPAALAEATDEFFPEHAKLGKELATALLRHREQFWREHEEEGARDLTGAFCLFCAAADYAMMVA
ncbi:hypothetical protein JL721_10830 [Aureococcus anophagefferens]|nr:hypothetical protein JL721_10830 [Aureococcus anophagefferens]